MRLYDLIRVLLLKLCINWNPLHICLLLDAVIRIIFRFKLFFVIDKKDKLVSHKFFNFFRIFTVMVFLLITLLKLYLNEACLV